MTMLYYVEGLHSGELYTRWLYRAIAGTYGEDYPMRCLNPLPLQTSPLPHSALVAEPWGNLMEGGVSVIPQTH